MKRAGDVLAVALVTALALDTNPAAAAVTTFTSASINSATAVYFDPAADSVVDETGADVSLSASGTHELAYNNGAGFAVKPTTDNTLAAGSLADGDIKTLALLGFGTDVSGAPVPVNTRNGSSSGLVTMADSFTAYAGNQPFGWTGGTKVRFALDVTGKTSIPEGLASATTSKNYIYSQLVIRIVKPGGIDLYRQLQTFDFGAYPTPEEAGAAYEVLSTAYQALKIDSTYWMFGEAIVDFPVDEAHVVALDPETPAHLEFEFLPGGDFEWIMEMDTTIHLDASLQNTSAEIDLSHTIATSYEGPEGATTYSASGVYPDTLPIEKAPVFLCGDFNVDGKITATDALGALKCAVGGYKCDYQHADVDDSGTLTAGDALKILKKAVGQEVVLDCPDS